MEPDALLCSRNARPPKALVGRAQVRFSVLTPHREGETRERGREVARQLAWSLCSQSPHDKAVVARCAQWRPHQPPRPSHLPVIRSHPHKRQRDFLLGKGYSSAAPKQKHKVTAGYESSASSRCHPHRPVRAEPRILQEPRLQRNPAVIFQPYSNCYSPYISAGKAW